MAYFSDEGDGLAGNISGSIDPIPPIPPASYWIDINGNPTYNVGQQFDINANIIRSIEYAQQTPVADVKQTPRFGDLGSTLIDDRLKGFGSNLLTWLNPLNTFNGKGAAAVGGMFNSLFAPATSLFPNIPQAQGDLSNFTFMGFTGIAAILLLMELTKRRN